MMALTDASRHDWLEGRGPVLTLIGVQDDPTSQILGRSMPCSTSSAPITITLRTHRLRYRFRLSPLAAPLRFGPLPQLALSARRCRHNLGVQSIALPPLPGVRGYAGETVELSHQLDGKLRLFRGDALLLVFPLPLEERAERRPKLLTSVQKRKTTLPRIYNLSGRPALAAVT
jgi:hypothetical protein